MNVVSKFFVIMATLKSLVPTE